MTLANKKFNTKKLKASLVLSALLLCSTGGFAEPDFSVLKISAKPETVKLINPKPFNPLEDGNTVININNGQKPKETVDLLQNKSADINLPDNISDNPFTPIPNENNEIIDTPTFNLEETPLQDTATEPDVNYANLVQKNNLEDIDIEGKLISHLLISGLDTVNQNVVLSRMNTREGSAYNTQLLQQDLQNIYDTGYFTDNMGFEPTVDSDGNIELVLRVNENIIVSKVSVMGNTVISTEELTEILSPLENVPQNVKTINEAVENINKYYNEKGYILAQVSDVSDTEDGELIFYINEGVINDISIEGNERTKDFIIQRNIMTQVGTVYNEELLKQDIARIYSTQIFKEVDRRIEKCEGEHGEYNVIVVIKEDSTNSVSLGGGIDSALGAFGSLGIKEDNFRGKGQKVHLSGMLGSGILLSDQSIKNKMNYQIELSFFEPHFINADNSLMSKLYFRELGSYNVPLAIERRVGAKAGVEHKVKGYDNLSTNLTLGLEGVFLKEGDYNRISSLYAAKGIDIKHRAQELADGFFLNINPGIKYSTLDSEDMPREGLIANAKFMESFCMTHAKRTTGRVGGEVTQYFPVREKSTLSITARAGAKVHGDNMPEFLAFRLGGPYSVRGYKMNGVGTGDAFVMGSAEFATPLPLLDKSKYDFLRNLRLTFFVDAGQIFNETTGSIIFDRPLTAVSAGGGLKMYIPGVGPISINYGVPLMHSGKYNSKSGCFTFGTGYLNSW